MSCGWLSDIHESQMGMERNGAERSGMECSMEKCVGSSLIAEYSRAVEQRALNLYGLTKYVSQYDRQRH